MIRKSGFVLILVTWALSCCLQVRAQETYMESYLDAADLDSLDAELADIRARYGTENPISFRDIFELLANGEVEEAISTVVTVFCENACGELLENRMLLVRLLLLVIVAAVFHNYSSILKASFVGEQGFYITYLMIAVLLMQSFSIVYEIAEDMIYYIKEIMECLLPAFYMSIVLCSGLSTSQMVNTMFLSMLAFLEKLICVIVLPAVRVYFLIVVLNQIQTTDRFSRLAALIKQGVLLLLKTVGTGIIGLNVMKSLLIPVYDNAKYNVLQKGLSVLPGGSSFSALSTILIGAGVLIRNSVGVSAVLILLVLGGIPILKLFCFLAAYKIILALIQPISDRRILLGIQGICDSTSVLIRAACTGLTLSVLSIAIVLLTTNV